MNWFGTARWVAGVLLCTACGDLTSATGAKGRLNYSLYTHYELEEWNLTEVSMVTGHPQLIQTDLTDKGENQLSGEPDDIVHTVVPSENVDVENSEEDGELSDLVMTAYEPGTYTIESQIDGQVFDYLEVDFAVPDELELVTWIRNPDDADFERVSGESIDIEEGGQVTFLPVPLASGDRLAGDITVSIAVFPETSAVRGENIWGVYEQNVVSTDTPVSLYFVEPGTVTISITDEPNEIEAIQTFEVESVEIPEV